MTRCCGWCEELFEPGPHRRRFCSRSCRSKHNFRDFDRWGENNPHYKGGVSRNPDGRKLKILPNGSQMLYSRWVMQEHLGRTLEFNEVVHHINGDRMDDRLENLEVLSRADHMALHRGELNAGKVRPARCNRGHLIDIATPASDCASCRTYKGFPVAA